jgi:nickel-dependent lactate racemase
MALEYDHLIICGPVFPHEVVGFSGGNKYFFPGISGPEVIDASHWLGALLTTTAIIGTIDTPVRNLIDRAASFIPVPVLCCAFVVEGMALGGLYVGSAKEAWRQAAELASQTHIVYVDRPFQRVLSVMPDLYDDIWTAAKGVYKLEPVVADGGEIVVYAPHISEVSYTHGCVLDNCGYHVRDYFLKQWDRFERQPWGVLAHATMVRGRGTYDPDSRIERARIRVTLATGIPRERCEMLGLGYIDPVDVDPEVWADREDEGMLLVRRAGEVLYRLKEKQN